MKKHKDILANAILLIFLILADQAAKYIIRSSGGFYICNKYLAFGLNLKYNLPLILLALVVLIILINSKLKVQSSKLQLKTKSLINIPLMLIMAGGVSNIIDRIHLGCVIDFMDLKFWPAFNLADVFITVGVIILVSQKLKRVTRNEK